MAISIEELRSHLQAFDFQGLFVEGLGWDHYRAELPALPVDGHEYTLRPVAEKADFTVLECGPGSDGAIPAYPVRRRIESAVVKSHFEHLIIFVDATRTQQVWQWVKRQAGKPAACREHRFDAGQTGQPLLQRLDSFLFTLDDEAKGIGISDVTAGVNKAFDVEKVTKRFYERFRAELTAFGGFIDGITAQGDRDWYASLMLNRMMFVYFVQKQGFLDGDLDYLRNRLKMVQEQSGGGCFQQFYRLFLLRLFHEGLGKPEAQRAPELAALLGRVPFLNGGLFDQHELERDNPDISIPDAAFERVFIFFDGYRWHLDERPYREDNEINPDVLGYIFEKYVNQKQMGAYYTKEDITGYISRNTVIPFLFDAARKECPVAFGPDGGVWRLLRDDPDRYIYPAVGHGITWNARQPEALVPLETPFDLADDIAAGISDVSKRGGWNASAPEDYALPTETWREVVARRSRYYEVRTQLAAGQVTEVNDLITLNLDIERFARDVIAQSEGPELLRAFWHALYGNREHSDTGISVLDPTCGSGAFLFAALNVLEPLYTACLEGMRGFLDDAERSERRRGPEHLRDFRSILEQVKGHSGEEQVDERRNERYFILKSIVLNNLYGVDIMEEAVEICKLRLFLKLVAQLETYDQIEPLPDIDFNIRAGNTLVGFTSIDAVRQAMTVMPNGQHRQVFPEDQAALDRINEEAEIASADYNQFRQQQTVIGGEGTSAEKQTLRERLRSLDNHLDRLLATEYGVNPKEAAEYESWRASHQPFHWFIEFYGVMNKGGFDVVIGNPPYVEYKTVGYDVGALRSFKFPDIYGYVVMQSYRIKSSKGRCGLIVPLSLNFSFEFVHLRRELAKAGVHWLSSYDNIPAALFAGVGQRCTIIVSAADDAGLFTSRLLRWRAPYRASLMSNVSYSKVPQEIDLGRFGVPRVPDSKSRRLLNLHIEASKAKPTVSAKGPEVVRLGFSSTARNFLSTYLNGPPNVFDDGTVSWDAALGPSLALSSQRHAYAALAATSGNACFWYWLTRGDGFHVTNSVLSDFLAPLENLTEDHIRLLGIVGEMLHEYRYSALVFKKNAGKYVGNYNYQTMKPLTLRADLVFLAGLGASWQDVEGLFTSVSLVRSVNESAGEKNIPKSVKSRFPQNDTSQILSRHRLDDLDQWIVAKYSIEPTSLTGIANA